MWKSILSLAMAAVMMVGMAAPATAASAELTSDQMFEVTKELYNRLGEIANKAAGDRIIPSVVADGTVILQGRTSSDETAEKARDAAAGIENVKRVVNSISTPGPPPVAAD